MSGNTFGRIFTVSTFGESHGSALGCIIDGCPPGIAIDANEIQAELDKRKPGQESCWIRRGGKRICLLCRSTALGLLRFLKKLSCVAPLELCVLVCCLGVAETFPLKAHPIFGVNSFPEHYAVVKERTWRA